VIGFTPTARVGSTQNLIGTKLYFAGGFTGLTQPYSNDFFYLDLSNSFQIDNPPWVSLSASVPISPTYSTSITSPLDNSTIYLIGGYMQNPSTNSPDNNTLVYTFNSNTTQWTIPTIGGSIPAGRQEMDGVVDNTGKVYIFGGYVITNSTSKNGNIFDDIIIFDISTNIWSTIQSTSNFPNPRIDYTAILLENNVIVYIGGREYASSTNQTQTLVNLDEVSSLLSSDL
ncbi:3944_t:CDS:1, partial [Acaulospora colombiana]